MSTDHLMVHLFGVIGNKQNVQIPTCGLAEMPEVPSSAVTCQLAAMSRHPQSSQIVYSCNRLACVVTRWAGKETSSTFQSTSSSHYADATVVATCCRCIAPPTAIKAGNQCY